VQEPDNAQETVGMPLETKFTA